ncbi:MAG: hypothetical protein J07HX64_01404 [halophilic archaeon J07HX64]|nr:MAG: hypothetical protein J07HX64_01404 [halophilic archaeon J07HX64]
MEQGELTSRTTVSRITNTEGASVRTELRRAGTTCARAIGAERHSEAPQDPRQ